MSNFHPLQVVGRGSETQLQVGAKLNHGNILTLPVLQMSSDLFLYFGKFFLRRDMTVTTRHQRPAETQSSVREEADSGRRDSITLTPPSCSLSCHRNRNSWSVSRRLQTSAKINYRNDRKTYNSTHWSHDVVATLNQRQWCWFNVVTASCAQWVVLHLFIKWVYSKTSLKMTKYDGIDSTYFIHSLRYICLVTIHKSWDYDVIK